MKVAFYRAKYGSILDRIIGFFTSGNFSHCELLFNNSYMISISPTENRLRLKKFDYSKLKEWELVEIDIDIQKEIEIQERLMLEIENNITQYDWLGALLSATFLNLQDEDRFFCSEFVASCLKELGVYSGDTVVNPNELYNILTRMKPI